MNHDNLSPEMTGLVRGFLKRRNGIGWLEWLPLAQLAMENPPGWLAVFNTLGAAGEEIVELLSQNDSGPLADMLLILLARNATQISHEQLRDFVVEDAVLAFERTGRRLQAMQSNCNSLREHARWVGERLEQGFNVARETTRLEVELAKLLAEEHRKAEEYDAIHALEREIFRLENYRMALSGYDKGARSTYRNELAAETEVLRREKETTQSVLAEQLAQLNTCRNEVEQLQQWRDTARGELDEELKRQSELRSEVERLRAGFLEVVDETKRLRLEHAELVQRYEREERGLEAARQRVRQARGKLDELLTHAADAGLIAIAQKIREVYDLLPRDEADRACRTAM